jgi:hypothetical protein
MVPLNLSPLYSRDSYPNRFWYLEYNTTEWIIFMSELVLAGNELAHFMLEKLPRSLPGATIIGQFLPDNTFSFFLTSPRP